MSSLGRNSEKVSIGEFTPQMVQEIDFFRFFAWDAAQGE
jgi:hypothetical protein